MHKIPNENLEFLCKQRERSQRHLQAALAVIHDQRQTKNHEKKMREEETLRLKKEKRDAWNEKRIKQKEKEKAEKFNEWMDKYGWQYKKKHEPNREEPEEEIPQLREERNLFQAVEEEEPKADFCAAESSPLISEIEVEHNSIKTELEQVEEKAEFVETFSSLDRDTFSFSTKRVYKVVKRRKTDEFTDGIILSHGSQESVINFSSVKGDSQIHQDHNYGCADPEIDPLKIEIKEERIE